MKWSIPERIINKARKYVAEDRVLSVEADYEQKLWHAQVMGHELYLVELDGTAREADTCQCLFWQEKGYCKHTVAVELYLREKGINRVMSEQTPQLMPSAPAEVSFSDLFTQGMVESVGKTSVVTHDQIQLTYQVDPLPTSPYHPELNFLGLSLKIGYQNERSYVVKNIGEFLNAYQKQSQFVVNQQYTFYLARDNFSETDQALLLLLKQIEESQQMLFQGGFAPKGKVDKKVLVLPALGLKTFLTQLFESGSAVLLLDGRFTSVAFAEGLPLTGQVAPAENGFALTINDPLTSFLAFYHYGFNEGTFYHANFAQESLYQTYQQLIKRQDKPEIFYPEKKASELFAQVLPLLNQIGTFTIAASLKSKVLIEPLQTVFHLRKFQGEILIRVDFNYGEARFSTNKKFNEKSTLPVIRLLKQEEKVTQLLKSLGYEARPTGFGKMLPQGAALYQFFKVEIPQMQTLGRVMLGAQLRGLLLNENVAPSVNVTTEDSWLAVHFDISGIAEHEVSQVVQAILKNENFYAAQDGRILDLGDEVFQQTAQTLQKLRGKWQKNGTLKIANYQGLKLTDALSPQQKIAYAPEFEQLVKDLTHPNHFKATIPPELNATLRDYQVKGFQWLKMLSHYQLGGILADEMGLGKTIQAIAYILSQKREELVSGPTLIVAPASLTYNWQSECAKFAPTLTVGLAVGTKDEREKVLAEANQFDVLITSYASLRQDEASYQSIKVACLILDEAQMVKNSATKTAQALRKLEIPQRFALSGTPIENNLSELWSLFAIIMPGFFPKKQEFKQLEVATIAKMIQPFVLRREKSTVLTELPEKIETNLYSSLLDEQKTLYLGYLSQMQAQVSEMDKLSFAKNRLSILAGLTRLRQICCDPRMFVDDYTGGSGKLEQLKEFLVNAKENNRRVLVFSQFTKMLSLIETELKGLGLKNFYLRGSTPPKDRIKMVNEFNEGERDVFLISLKAGGTGLNLTGADTVVLYDLWWNPAVEQQAAGRAHRIGQKKVVEVWRMIAKGTIEEKMDALQNEKKALFEDVLAGNEQEASKLTEEDIREILSLGD